VPVPFPFVQVGGTALDPFFNANTPQELADLRALLTRAAP
jgi:molybdopterin-guanine dinucleotide biosynthesis protein A